MVVVGVVVAVSVGGKQTVVFMMNERVLSMCVSVSDGYIYPCIGGGGHSISEVGVEVIVSGFLPLG